MKIDYVLMGSTTDPFYLDFWPIVSKIWKEVFNITPILGLMTDKETELYESEYGYIKEFKTYGNINVGSQSQYVRMYLSKFLKGNCIISDIDIIPLSKQYFISDLIEYSDDDLIIMSSHHEQTRNINQYPMCYVVGNSKTFNNVFNTDLEWDVFVKKVYESSDEKWFSDQVFLYNSIKSYGFDNVKFPVRSFNNDRVDRSYWSYNCNLVKEGIYIDSHLLRPYKEFENEINELIKCLV